MKYRAIMLAVGALAIGLSAEAGLARPQVSSQAAPGVNFSAYKTYSWVAAQGDLGANPVMGQEIQNDFDAALASKGYNRVAQGGDLSLILTVGQQQKTDIESWGRFGLQTSVFQYTEGQLSLDVFDARTKQALWHGHATETINPDNPKQSKVDEAVAKLMASFPATAATAPAPAPAPQQ